MSSKKLTCKSSLRQVYIRVYRLEKQSVMLVFSTQLCELLYGVPLTFSLVQLSPLPPFSVWVSTFTVYTYKVCKAGGVWGSGPQTDKQRPQSPFTSKFFRWRHFALSVMSLIFLRVYPTWISLGLRTGSQSRDQIVQRGEGLAIAFFLQNTVDVFVFFFTGN